MVLFFCVVTVYYESFALKMTKFGDKKTVTGMYINAIMKKNKKRSRELYEEYGEKDTLHSIFYRSMCLACRMWEEI